MVVICPPSFPPDTFEQVSEVTYSLILSLPSPLANADEFEARGEVPVKGKGLMRTYLSYAVLEELPSSPLSQTLSQFHSVMKPTSSLPHAPMSVLPQSQIDAIVHGKQGK